MSGWVDSENISHDILTIKFHIDLILFLLYDCFLLDIKVNLLTYQNQKDDDQAKALPLLRATK